MFLMNGFSDKVKQKLGYYVYALADPRDNKIFYIGKGINNRIFQHEEKLDNSNKSNRIKEILSSGNKIKKLIISYGLSEKEAFVAESALINIMNYIDSQSLTNVVSGHHTAPVITAEDFEKIYGAEILSKEDIFHNLLIVKINSLYKYDMSDSQVMECARGHWIIDTKRAENCDYLIAVNHGLIVGVYENMKWYSSGVETPFYPRLCKENLSRSNRKYCTCQAVNKPNIYINKNIADLVNMTQNPISYINGRKNTAKVLKPYYEKFINNSMDIHDFEMNFGNDLVKMGFKLGSFNDSKYEYNNKNILNITDYKQLKKMLKHTDYSTATSLLISKWRYITHWSYMDYQQEKDLPFFKAVIERIFELSE
uniref:LEM-3-like GIY-YIG domain-containing protein n=1 Tax=Ruminococcus bromii TaxID=40518 RepID=UPI003FEE07FA